MTPSPGQVYWASVEGRPRRPWGVASRETLNRGAYVLAVPCTTARLDSRRSLPSCVPLAAGEGGVTKDCVIQAESCSGVLREELEGAALGRLSPDRWRDMVRALGYVFGATCEPG